MKTTPFTEKHISLGAKMHEFAGYNMPIEYSGIIDEHLTVCQGVGVFDVSHMGEFWVKGPHALDFLQKVTSNNIAALTPGKVQYTCFPNENGGIVDDLLVYHYEPEKYLLVVNASNIEKDWNWCVSHNTEGAELENASEHMAQLAVQGPKAIQALQKLTSINLSDLPYYTFTHGEFAGEKDVIISNTGYTGAGGFELYFYPEAAMKIWDAVFEAGAEFGIKPVVDGKKVTVYDEVEKEIKKDMPSRLHARRQMVKALYDVTEVPTAAAGKKKNTKKVDLTNKLFNEIAPKYASRNGGYTRIIKIGQRKGDGAMAVLIELV